MRSVIDRHLGVSAARRRSTSSVHTVEAKRVGQRRRRRSAQPRVSALVDRGSACISCPIRTGHGSLRPTFWPARVNGGGARGRRQSSARRRRAPRRSRRAGSARWTPRGASSTACTSCCGAHLHGQHDLHDVLLDAVEHVGEQLERFALVFLLRILLRVAAQVDALAQVIERGKVLAPMLIERMCSIRLRSN